jgi:tetratricopeptide (TPR) repeat protein
MEHNLTAKNELIDVCKKQYPNNSKQLAIIDEFENSYHCSKAIWWYTRESCLYRILNKALRVQNIDVFFAFRFFIKDMFKSLSEEHKKFKHPLTGQFSRVYRGQVISTDEFDRMQKSIGEFISINSFFSTSRNRKRALEFASNVMPTGGIRQILFDIQVDIRLSTKPFADVTKLSYFKEEEEIIFMLGSVFRITNVIYSKPDHVWVAELMLCNENDHDLRDLFAYHKERIGKDLSNVVSLGDILFKMGEFDKAKQYYNRILNELSTINLSAASCYFGLGNVAIEQDEYPAALAYHLKALDIKKKFLAGNDSNLASSYNQIGAAFRRLCVYDRALEYTNIGLKMRLECLDSNDVDLAQSYRDIGLAYHRLSENGLALKNFTKAHEIYVKVLPENHPDIAENLSYIGYVYNATEEYDQALGYYKKALEIDRKSLPGNHPDIGVISMAIGQVFYHQRDYTSALHYFSQARTIYHKSLSPSHEFTEDAERMVKLTKQMLLMISQEAD